MSVQVILNISLKSRSALLLPYTVCKAANGPLIADFLSKPSI